MNAGSNLGVTYEEVKAVQVRQGINALANSGGYTTGGIYIEWDANSGFTGNGWRLGDSHSPAYNYTQEQIDSLIEQDGNLDTMFSNWVKSVHYETRYSWILQHISSNCRYEITG